MSSFVSPEHAHASAGAVDTKLCARHVTIQIRKDGLSRAAYIFEHDVLPLLRVQPGFRDALMLADRASGEGVIAIFWDDPLATLRLEAAGFYREQIAKFQDVFAAPPRAVLFEVLCASSSGRHGVEVEALPPVHPATEAEQHSG